MMDEPYPGMEGNYIESSGTAMYTYGLLKGVRRGFLERGEFKGVVERAYEGMVGRFVVVDEEGGGMEAEGGRLSWEGTVRVGSLDGLGDYKVRLLYCQGLWL